MEDEDRIDQLEERLRIAEVKTLIYGMVTMAIAGLSWNRDQLHATIQSMWHALRVGLGENPSDETIQAVSNIRDQLSAVLGRQVL